MLKLRGIGRASKQINSLKARYSARLRGAPERVWGSNASRDLPMTKHTKINRLAARNSDPVDINIEIDRIEALPIAELRPFWERTFGRRAPKAFTRDLLVWSLTWHIQEKAFGGFDRETLNVLKAYAKGKPEDIAKVRRLKTGTVLVREYQGERHTVTITPEGFVWREKTYSSLTIIARTITGTFWNGPRFFGLRAEGTRYQQIKSASNIALKAGNEDEEPYMVRSREAAKP